MKEGRGQASVTFSQSSADTLFSATQNSPDSDTDYESLAASLYLEHGLTDSLTLGLKTGLQEAEYNDFDQNDYSGVSESELFARKVLWTHKNHIVSGQVGAIITPQTTQAVTTTFGQRNLGWEVRGLAGTGGQVFGRWCFAEVQVAHRSYDNTRPQELRVDLTAGQYIHDNWQIVGQLFTTSSYGEQSEFFGYDSNKAQVLLFYDRGYDLSYQFGWPAEPLGTQRGQRGRASYGVSVSLLGALIAGAEAGG